MYKCDFCSKPYEWYEGVHNDKKRFCSANSLQFVCYSPFDSSVDGEQCRTLDESPVNPVPDVIDVCPECMHKLLDALNFNKNKLWDII